MYSQACSPIIESERAGQKIGTPKSEADLSIDFSSSILEPRTLRNSVPVIVSELWGSASWRISSNRTKSSSPT